MSDAPKNPAPCDFPTAVIVTDSGPVTVICEPVTEHIAITPAFGMDDNGAAWLDGGYVITHRKTGMRISDGAGCINCARASANKLAELPGWEGVTDETGPNWARSLTDEQRETLQLYRALEWACDADLCEDVEPAGYVPAAETEKAAAR